MHIAWAPRNFSRRLFCSIQIHKEQTNERTNNSSNDDDHDDKNLHKRKTMCTESGAIYSLFRIFSLYIELVGLHRRGYISFFPGSRSLSAHYYWKKSSNDEEIKTTTTVHGGTYTQCIKANIWLRFWGAQTICTYPIWSYIGFIIHSKQTELFTIDLFILSIPVFPNVPIESEGIWWQMCVDKSRSRKMQKMKTNAFIYCNRSLNDTRNGKSIQHRQASSNKRENENKFFSIPQRIFGLQKKTDE